MNYTDRPSRSKHLNRNLLHEVTIQTIRYCNIWSGEHTSRYAGQASMHTSAHHITSIQTEPCLKTKFSYPEPHRARLGTVPHFGQILQRVCDAVALAQCKVVFRQEITGIVSQQSSLEEREMNKRIEEEKEGEREIKKVKKIGKKEGIKIYEREIKKREDKEEK